MIYPASGFKRTRSSCRRAPVGPCSVFMRLQVEVSWHRQFPELIDDFDETRLAERQAAALAAAGVPPPHPTDGRRRLNNLPKNADYAAA
jgi:hypothetical protein